MKILITGISGLLGANAAYLWHKKHQVCGQYHEHPFSAAKIAAIRGDLTKESLELSRFLEQFRPEAIMHCAALANVDACEKDKEQAFKINAEATAWLAGISVNIGARFILISTDAVYKDGPGRHKESSPLSPLNEYGRSKLAGEESVKRSCKEYLILRTTIYGYNYQDKLSLGEWVISELKKSKTVKMFNDVSFSPILVNDLAAAVDELLQKKITGVYNLAAKDTVSKFEFGKKIAKVFGLDENLIEPVSIDSHPFTAKRQKNMAMDSTEVSRFIPVPTVDEGVERFFRLYKDGYPSKLKKGEWS